MLVTFSLVSSLFLNSASVENTLHIDVFYASNEIVSEEGFSADHTVSLHNLALKNLATQKLNQLAVQFLEKNTDISLSSNYQMAFNKLTKTHHWKSLYKDFEKSGLGVSKAVRLNVQKVPAIVINDNYVVYGTYDVNKAVSLYRNFEGRR